MTTQRSSIGSTCGSRPPPGGVVSGFVGPRWQVQHVTREPVVASSAPSVSSSGARATEGPDEPLRIVRADQEVRAASQIQLDGFEA